MQKSKHQRLDIFNLWCWGRLLRVPWTARRSNQSILKEINPEYSLEGLMLKLKLQYFSPWYEEPTHWKGPWCWERLRAGGEGSNRGWDGWMASPSSMDMGLSKLWEMVKDKEAWLLWAMGHKELDKTETLNNNNNEKKFPRCGREGYLQRSWHCLWVENLIFTLKDTKAESKSIVLERLSVRMRETERERERERENYAKLRGSIPSIHQRTDLCVHLKKIPGAGERFTQMN